MIGRHPVKEALIANRKINKLFVQDGIEGRPIDEIINLANKNRIVISYVPKNKLDQLSDHQNHQGSKCQRVRLNMRQLMNYLKSQRLKKNVPFLQC